MSSDTPPDAHPQPLDANNTTTTSSTFYPSSGKPPAALTVILSIACGIVGTCILLTFVLLLLRHRSSNQAFRQGQQQQQQQQQQHSLPAPSASNFELTLKSHSDMPVDDGSGSRRARDADTEENEIAMYLPVLLHSGSAPSTQRSNTILKKTEMKTTTSDRRGGALGAPPLAYPDAV